MKQISKKLASVITLLCAAFPFAASAQQEATAVSVNAAQEVEFNPHWFLQLQAGGGYTVGEADFNKLLSPAAAINVGYRFSPSFGLRIGGSGWQAKGALVNPHKRYKYNYLQGNIDAMLSLSNLFCGYNPDRTLDFYGFLGLGGTLGYHNRQANELSAAGYHLEKLWSGKKLFFDVRGGLGVNINLSRVVALNLEANANMLPDGFNSKKGSNRDWQLNGLVGVTISFGRTKTRTVEVIETAEVVQPAPEPQPQPAPAPVVEQPKPVEAKQPASMEQDIFFKINSSKISTAETEKIDRMISFLKENPEAKVIVTGYADKGTGTAAYNLKISRFRAQSVADALRNGGIDASRITVNALGDTEQPFTENNKNRVAIAVAE